MKYYFIQSLGWDWSHLPSQSYIKISTDFWGGIVSNRIQTGYILVKINQSQEIELRIKGYDLIELSDILLHLGKHIKNKADYGVDDIVYTHHANSANFCNDKLMSLIAEQHYVITDIDRFVEWYKSANTTNGNIIKMLIIR